MEKHAVQAIIGMLKSSVKAWIFGAAKLIGRLIINPDNEPFILPFGPQFQLNRSEQKCDLRESSLAKVESQRRNASNFHCLSPDYEIKETKNIYVDSNESLNGTEGTNSVKVLNGVVQGRTRTPVERFERRERLNSDEVQAPDTTPQIIPKTPQIIPETAKISPVLILVVQIQLPSPLLCLVAVNYHHKELVCHILERNNIKGAIDATRKLPDHSVGTSRPDQCSHGENEDSYLRFALNNMGG
ncbi:hypothetical protein HYC85_007773 [Camellia sinensis]|uniref:Uncharacterized protein n=1 Tax=Camellia sinensis TaxID=4442 RepID=A0A7J7HR97_CAMSI|nr:hypothetical protein HYC85_007773 [Camellia sinensis]